MDSSGIFWNVELVKNHLKQDALDGSGGNVERAVLWLRWGPNTR